MGYALTVIHIYGILNNMEDKKITRINSFIETEDYKKLKIMLIMQGKSLTQWLKDKVKEEIAKPLDQTASQTE